MVYKLTSTNSIIAKVMADLNLSEDDLRITDVREWIAEAVEKIGAITQLQPKVGGVDGAPILELIGHQAALPCDLHQLHQVAYAFSENGPWFPMRKSTGSFAVWKSDDCCNCENNCGGCSKDCVEDTIIVNTLVDMIGNVSKEQALHILNTNQNARTILTNLIGDCSYYPCGGGNCCGKERNSNPNKDLQYNVKPGYITSNMRSGFLKLSYNAVPTDEAGYVLVPDVASVAEAIYWYVAMKLLYPKYLRGDMDHERYYSIRRSWNFYRQQAYAELLMPNADEMESIKNTWNKLVPEMNDHTTFYSHTGARQNYYDQQYS